MAKINNRGIYKNIDSPSLSDFLLGTKEEDGSTKSFPLQSVIQLINGVNGKNNIQYKFSDGSDPDIDYTTSGTFFTNNNSTSLPNFTELIFNKENLQPFDLSLLFNKIGVSEDIILKLEHPENPNIFFNLKVISFVDNTEYFVFGVQPFKDFYLGSLENEKIYSLYFDLQVISEEEKADKIIKSGNINISGLTISILENDFQWRINQQDFLNTPELINFPIPPAADGFYRSDILVGTSNNDYQLIQGTPDSSASVEPQAPINTIRIAGISLFGAIVGQPTPTPITNFIEKSERANVVITGSGVINQLDLVDEKATIVFKDAITRLNTISYASVPYNGKRITLFNAQATPVTIGHSVSGYGVDFVFTDAQDYILLPNQTIEFSFDITYAPYAHHMFIGSKGITNWSELQGKPSTFPPSAHTHIVSQITDFPTFKTIENQSIIGAGNIDLDKNSVGLGNVDNTSDLNKTISTATQTALNAKANISGQVFTGAVSATNLSGTNTGDNAPNSLYSGLVTNATHTGEVTGSTALTITNGAVTNAKLANVATSTLKGRVSATTGVVEDLTASQVRTLLNVANGANNYVHPANHLASIITQDASNRFVTDTEKSAWNAKESAIASGTISQYWRGDKTWQEFPTIQTIDNIPTDGSNNAVSSNGVFDALATKAPISSVHNPVTLGTANGLSLSTQQLSLGLASSGVTGALSGTDWNTFNGKFNTPTGLTTNYLPKWTGSGFGDSSIFDNGTNIGIGTTNPTLSKLHTKGNDGSIIGYFYNNSGTAGQVKGVVIEAGTNASDFALLVNSSQGSPYYKINGNGNSLFGAISDDNLVDRVQVAGTISAYPATTANQVVVKSQLDSKASLSGATFTGDVTIPIARLDKLYLKSSPSNPDLSAIIAISKNINAVTSHIIEDSSTITPPSGADGYGLVDMSTTVNGSNPATHVHAYQSRITYTSSANMPANNFSSISSFYSENRISGTGVVDKVIGLKVVDTYMAQANKINKQYGILIENQTVGAINYGIWNDTRGNYMKGLSIGTDTIDLSNALNVNGTISASPATTANQVVVKSQLDAVAARPYKVYTALLSQTGTNAPTATVLENTLGGTVVWTRFGTGVYKATLSNAFTSNKTFLLTGLRASAGATYSTILTLLTNTASDVQLVTTLSDAARSLSDGLLTGDSIEIRVYN